MKLADNSHTLKITILGTVVGGLILSFILWLLGFLPSIGSWILSSSISIWNITSTDVATPVWVLTILAILSLPKLWNSGVKVLPYITPAKNDKLIDILVNEEPVHQNFDPKLTENELLVLRALTTEDGNSAQLGSIANRIKQNQLRTEQTIDSLMDKGFVSDSLNYIYGTSYFLSSKGRDLVIELGFA